MMIPQNDLITIPTIEDATRRQFMSGTLAAALLVACGSDEEVTPEPATRTVQDVFGTVEVPTRPQRVILLNQNTAGNAVFLGFPIENIASVAWDPAGSGDISYLPKHQELMALPNVGAWHEPDIEKIIQLNADLIVNFGVDDEDTVKRRDMYSVSGIPVFTVYNGWATVDEAMRFLRDVGRALNLEARAAEEEAKFRAALDAVRAKLAGKPLPTVSTIRPFPNGSFWANASPILNALGFPGSRPTLEQPSLRYSEENFRDLDGDYIVAYAHPGDTQEVVRQRLGTSPTWHLLSAVQAGRVYYVQPTGWLFWNVPALYLGLKDIEEILTN